MSGSMLARKSEGRALHVRHGPLRRVRRQPGAVGRSLSSRPHPTAARLDAASGVVLAVIGGALITREAGRAVSLIAATESTRTIAPLELFAGFAQRIGAPWAEPVAAAASNLVLVAVGLTFGILIAAAVRALVPERWLRRAFAFAGFKSVASGLLAGAPLMLCSTAMAPIFEALHARARRLGPAITAMLAAPLLNPAALALTCILFSPRIALLRAGLGFVVPLAVGALVGALCDRVRPAEPLPGTSRTRYLEASAPAGFRAGPTSGAISLEALGRSLGRSIAETAARALPSTLLGVLLSAVISSLAPLCAIASLSAEGTPVALVVIPAAAVAVLVAFPSLGELPVAFALAQAGAPAALVVAVLIAGPAVNLPSLLVVRRAASPRAAVVLALSVFASALAGGALAHLLRV